MSMEVGKNRLEALGDVEESAVFFRYYSTQIEDNDGFDRPMDRLSDAEITSSVLRPYGVWGVIVPFNYPMALAAGPTAAALVAGNTVLIKPSPQGTFSAAKLHECLLEAGVPADAVHLLPGGDEVGRQLVAHPGVDGLTFTGSYEVGMQIERSFLTDFPKPIIAEMGGKNPTVVSRHADLAAAALGRGPLGVRPVRTEVLGLLAGIRRARGARRLPRRAGRAGAGAGGRRADRAQHVPRAR